MNEKLKAWFHDDITWCMQQDCPLTDCMRNTKNMMDPSGLHSFAVFRQTDECPIYRMEQQVMLDGGDDE